jgi:hypothetical protein
MKTTLIAAAVFLALTASQPAAAQSTCSEAFAGCQKVQDGTRCDVVCKAFCTKQKTACMKTGNFSSKNNQFTGLQKK